MSASIVARGRLGRKPSELKTKSGLPMARGSLAVTGSDREEPLWIALIAFGDQATELLRYAKGDVLSVTGRLEQSSWTPPNGEPRRDLQCVVEQLIGARPKPRKAKQTAIDFKPPDLSRETTP